MNLIDLLNRIGHVKGLKPVVHLLLLTVVKIQFPLLPRIAGRRIVSASAGAPAVLLTHSTIKDALKDPRLLYKAMTYTVEEMGLDTLCLFVDMSLEAEACGCQTKFDDYNAPVVMSHPVKTIDDLAELKVPDPHLNGRMPVFLETMRLMKRNFSMLKIGEVIGPFTLAAHLAGTDIYLDTRKNPQKIRAILEYCEKVIIRYAQALIKSGADMIIIAEPTGSQISASAYEDFSLTCTRKIIRSLARPCILHVCGKAGHIIEKMCQSGAVALSIDDVDIAQVIKSVPHSIVVIGNISPQKFSKSSPEEIEGETIKLLETVKTRKEFLVAPGCDLAPQTPLENILSFTKAAREYRRK
ncbi:MAG TPA: uroporphyrinogen decarboxylase family protein [Dehalococcoidales bacterium]|nr:uroporphyrinogen decarboxylase family protein [Dehalococcoidales bacterium]